jgi:hypothetical protein
VLYLGEEPGKLLRSDLQSGDVCDCSIELGIEGDCTLTVIGVLFERVKEKITRDIKEVRKLRGAVCRLHCV